MAGKEISREELRERLFQTFRERGVLEHMKSVLRKRLVTELQSSGDISLSSERNEVSLFIRAANSIIANHLEQFGYEYTRAVFLPESGLSVSKPMSMSEILSLLHVEPASSIYKSLASHQADKAGSGSVWELMVQLVSQDGGSQRSCGVQTQETGHYASGLSFADEEVRRLQKLFADDLERHKLAESERAQEEIRQVRRQCERTKREQMDQEMENFRGVELERARLQEKDKWLRKISSLQEQISELTEQRFDEKEKWEHEIHLAKEQIRALRENEVEMKRQVERYEEILQASKRSEERAVVEGSGHGTGSGVPLENYTQEQEAAMESARAEVEAQYEERFKAEVDRYKRGQELELQRKMQDIERREADLGEARRRFERECDRVKSAVVAESELNSVSTDLRQVNEVLTRQLEEMKDYRELKANGQELESLVESLRQQLSEQAEDVAKQQAEYEKVVQEATDNSSRLESELYESRLEISMLRDQVDNFKHSGEESAAQLREERAANKVLRGLYEVQLRQQKELMKEFEEFQATMGMPHPEGVSEGERSRLSDGGGSIRGRIDEPARGQRTFVDGEEATTDEDSSSSGGLVTTSNNVLERMDRRAQELDVLFGRFLASVNGTNDRQGPISRRTRNAFVTTPGLFGRATQQDHVMPTRDALGVDRPFGQQPPMDSARPSFLSSASSHPLSEDSFCRPRIDNVLARRGVSELAHESFDSRSEEQRHPDAGPQVMLQRRIDNGSGKRQQHDSIPAVPYARFDSASAAHRGWPDSASTAHRVSFVEPNIVRNPSIRGSATDGHLPDFTRDVSASSVDRAVDMFPSDRYLNAGTAEHVSTRRGTSDAGRGPGSLSGGFQPDRRRSTDADPNRSVPRASMSSDARAAVSAALPPHHCPEPGTIPRDPVDGKPGSDSDKDTGRATEFHLPEHRLAAVYDPRHHNGGGFVSASGFIGGGSLPVGHKDTDRSTDFSLSEHRLSSVADPRDAGGGGSVSASGFIGRGSLPVGHKDADRSTDFSLSEHRLSSVIDPRHGGSGGGSVLAGDHTGGESVPTSYRDTVLSDHRFSSVIDARDGAGGGGSVSAGDHTGGESVPTSYRDTVLSEHRFSSVIDPRDGASGGGSVSAGDHTGGESVPTSYRNTVLSEHRLSSVVDPGEATAGEAAPGAGESAVDPDRPSSPSATGRPSSRGDGDPTGEEQYLAYPSQARSPTEARGSFTESPRSPAESQPALRDTDDGDWAGALESGGLSWTGQSDRKVSDAAETRAREQRDQETLEQTKQEEGQGGVDAGFPLGSGNQPDEEPPLLGLEGLQSPRIAAASQADPGERAPEGAEGRKGRDSDMEYEDLQFSGLEKEDIESFYPDRQDVSSESSW